MTGKDKSIVPHVCKKMTRMPNMTKINSTAMLAKILSEKNRYVRVSVFSVIFCLYSKCSCMLLHVIVNYIFMCRGERVF